jgi:aspartate 1-decarboxylase
MKFVLNSKIFRAAVTQANVKYEDSTTIDTDPCDKAGFLIGKKVVVISNITGGGLT